jgi:hypothetical protein
LWLVAGAAPWWPVEQTCSGDGAAAAIARDMVGMSDASMIAKKAIHAVTR